MDEVKELEIQEDYSLLREEEEEDIMDGFSIEFYPEMLLDDLERR